MLNFNNIGAPPEEVFIPVYQRSNNTKFSLLIDKKDDERRMIKGWKTSDDNYSILMHYGGEVIANDSPIRSNFHVTHNRKTVVTQPKKMTASAVFNSCSFSQFNQANKGNYS